MLQVKRMMASDNTHLKILNLLTSPIPVPTTVYDPVRGLFLVPENDTVTEQNQKVSIEVFLAPECLVWYGVSPQKS